MKTNLSCEEVSLHEEGPIRSGKDRDCDGATSATVCLGFQNVIFLPKFNATFVLQHLCKGTAFLYCNCKIFCLNICIVHS
jgi:hypothetical protein